MNTISALLKALEQYFRWQSIRAEIRAKKQLIILLEEEEQKANELEKEIKNLRKHDDHIAADELLLRNTRRFLYRQGLLNLAKRTNIYSPQEDDTSGTLGS